MSPNKLHLFAYANKAGTARYARDYVSASDHYTSVCDMRIAWLLSEGFNQAELNASGFVVTA